MNPFLLVPPRPSIADMMPLDETRSSLRMMRLHQDLTVLSSDLDLDSQDGVTILRTGTRLLISSLNNEENLTPLLAMALRANIERMIAVAEQVRARLPIDWRRRLIG